MNWTNATLPGGTSLPPRRHLPVGPGPVLFVLALIVLVSGTARAFGVCERSCSGSVSACASAVAATAACEVKMHAYNVYMAQMGAGVQRRSFPAIYKDILGPHYPLANLDSYRFGTSDRQPPHNATTDCATTYFNSTSYVNAIRNSTGLSDWSWLLHEVTHAEQCAALGSRERYAKRWWDEMDTALNARGRKVNVLQSPDQLAQQLGDLFLLVHDDMPMEVEADARASRVLAELTACCIDQDGRLVRPLRLLAIEGPLERRLRILTEGGAPRSARFWVKGPGDTSPIEQPARSISGLDLSFNPRLDPALGVITTTAALTRTNWTFEVEAEVRQGTDALPRLRIRRTVVVSHLSVRRLADDSPPRVDLPRLPSELPLPTGPTPGRPVGPRPRPLGG